MSCEPLDTDQQAAHDALAETTAPEKFAGDRTPPQLPADYRIVREIGSGGMGVVYLAEQKSLGRNIAVKVLRPGEVAFGPLVQRFMDEAKHLAKLRHPNIVPIHEVGEATGEPYFTMDFVDGCSLADLLKEGPLSPSRTLALFKQMATAVAHAHSHSIIHRDLKPANVLVAREERLTADEHQSAGVNEHVFVSDFGLARDLSSDSGLTGSGAILGTPAYMAPEQARGQTKLIGEATDVHALGAILYEMLTGRAPYGKGAAADVFVRLLETEPTPPRTLDKRIPRDLETICLKALSKKPERRYGSVQAMLADIERFETGTPILARRTSLLERAGRVVWRQRKSIAAVTIAVAICLMVIRILFDRSAEQLMLWGHEYHASGEHAEAVRMFERAAQVASGSERHAALELMLRCADKADDAKAVIDAALMIMEYDPDRSFEDRDWLVAQAAVAQVRTNNSSQELCLTSEEDDPLVRLVRDRLRVFLDDGGGTAQHQEEARILLRQVEDELVERPGRGLTNGRSATWYIEALDDNDRRIGVSRESERPFLVAGEWP